MNKDFEKALKGKKKKAKVIPLKPTVKQMKDSIEEFREEQNELAKKREKRLDKNETLTITVQVRGCEDCRHRDHSGSFTPGGAKQICGHHDISETILKLKPHTRNDDANALSNNKKADNHIDKQCYYWKNRVVDKYIEKGTIPYFCPIKNGSSY